MLRSLHRKLMLILVMLILALMMVVGAFLINGVLHFYSQEFFTQMSEVWSNHPDFVDALRKASEEVSAPTAMSGVMRAYSGILGIDARRRNYYILDGERAACLQSSDLENRQPDLTPNILSALSGEPGNASRLTDPYFDIAVPVGAYIVYVRDNKESLQTLTTEMFMIILEAVMFGLVISIMLSFLLSKTMTTPLENLTRSARMVAAGDFSDKLAVHSSDEIGVLTQTFNNMAHVLKDTLEAVGSERDKLGTLFLHMTDGVAAFSAGGELIHINPAAEKMLGVSSRASLQFADLFADAVSWEDAQCLRPPVFLERDMTRAGRTLKLFLAAYGEFSSAQASSAGTGGVIIIVHDITEQFRMEEARREFVSNVSHELRTPLTNIKSYAETLCEGGDLPPETVQNFSQVISNEADRMTRIVRDLLTLSRFDYGKMDWNMGLFNIGEAIRSIYDANLLEAKRRGHSMTLEYLHMPPEIWGDRDRIEQVLANIIVNAIHYTPDGGVIEISLDRNAEHAIVKVADNGAGIPAEALPRLFERFFRVDRHRSRASGGTGLGLAIAREIVVQHRGDIHVDSEPGKGTTMTVRLPLKRPAP